MQGELATVIRIRKQYVVSACEFNDVKGPLAALENRQRINDAKESRPRRQQRSEGGTAREDDHPTLMRRMSAERRSKKGVGPMEASIATGAVAFSSILMATDFSPDSMRGLPYALDLTKRYDAKLYLAHVVDALVVAGSEQMANSLEREQREAECKLGNLAESAVSSGIQCQPLIGKGDIGLVLKEFVVDHRVDLVVVGTVGHTGLSKVVLGSIAEELVRECPCPVLTVGRRVAGVGTIHTGGILCPIDFSSESLAAVPFAVSLAEKYGCSLAMLHCLEGIPESPYVESQLAKARLRDMVPDCLKAEILVDLGSPATLIPNLVEQRNFGLVVMGARGAGSFARARSHFGSIAHKIITHAPCPVLTVREQRQ